MPATLTTVLLELGPYFALPVDRGARPVQDLYRNTDGALTNLIARHAGRLRTTEQRVAASILFQEFAARIWSPVLGALALSLRPPDLSTNRLRWRENPFGLCVTEHEDTDAEPGILIGEHLMPMVNAINDTMGVAKGLLWGNATSALMGTLTVLRLNGRKLDMRIVHELLEREPLRGTGALGEGDPPSFRRRSCCLYYRVPGGGLCGDCCLTHVPARV
jgi:iron complex transport system ATP-binding protein